MEFKLNLDGKIVKSGLYNTEVNESARCVGYTQGSLGALYDYFVKWGGEGIEFKNTNVVGYIELSKKDYVKHIMDLSKSSNVYSVAEYLLDYANTDEDSFVRVYSGSESYLVRCSDSTIDRLGIVQPKLSKLINKFKVMLKK